MKTKTILIVFSLAAFLFTSCQKDEMGVGGTDGGGKQDAFVSYKLKDTLLYPMDEKIDAANSDTKKNTYPDSLGITLIDKSIK